MTSGHQLPVSGTQAADSNRESGFGNRGNRSNPGSYLTPYNYYSSKCSINNLSCLSCQEKISNEFKGELGNRRGNRLATDATGQLPACSPKEVR